MNGQDNGHPVDPEPLGPLHDIVVTRHRTEFRVHASVLALEDGNLAHAASIAAHRWKVAADHATSKGVEFGQPLVEITAPDDDGVIVIAVSTNTAMTRAPVTVD